MEVSHGFDSVSEQYSTDCVVAVIMVLCVHVLPSNYIHMCAPPVSVFTM